MKKLLKEIENLENIMNYSTCTLETRIELTKERENLNDNIQDPDTKRRRRSNQET